MAYRIFISYRRADSQMAAGRIYDRLRLEYGAPAVFKDVDDIPAGSDFRQILAEAVNQSDVLLAVIGAEWVGIQDAQGNRRLDNPNDFVRIEIESAFAQNITVIPLFIDGREGLAPNELPDGLQDLAFRNAIQIRPDPDFHKDVDRLIRALGENFERADALRVENTSALAEIVVALTTFGNRMATLTDLNATEKGARTRLQKKLTTAKTAVTTQLGNGSELGRTLALAEYRAPLDEMEEALLALEAQTEERKQAQAHAQASEEEKAAQRDREAQAAAVKEAAEQAAFNNERQQHEEQLRKALQSLLDDCQALLDKLGAPKDMDPAEVQEHASIATRLGSLMDEMDALLGDAEKLVLGIDLAPYQQRTDRLTTALTTLQDQHRARMRTEKEENDRKEKEQREAERIRKSLNHQRDDLQKLLAQLEAATDRDTLDSPYKEDGDLLVDRLQNLTQQVDDALASLPPQVSDSAKIDDYQLALTELKTEVMLWRKEARASQPRNLKWMYYLGGALAVALLIWWGVNYEPVLSIADVPTQPAAAEENVVGDSTEGTGSEDAGETVNVASVWVESERFNERGIIEDIAMSPDGTMLAVASSTGVWFYNYPSMALHKSFKPDTWISTVAWSPDSQRIVAGSWSGHIYIYNLESEVHEFESAGQAEGVFTVAWSPDGSRIASNGVGGEIVIWNPDTGGTFAPLVGHAQLVKTVAWSSDGQYLASGGDDGTVRVWDVGNAEALAVYRPDGDNQMRVDSVVWFPDDNFLVSADTDGGIYAWAMPEEGTGESSTYQYAQFGHNNASIIDLAMTPDGILISAGENWDMNRWESHAESPSVSIGTRASLVSMTSNADGTALIFTLMTGEIFSWDLTTAAPVSINHDHVAGIADLSFSPNEDRVAVAQRTQLIVQEIDNGTNIFEMEHDGEVLTVAWDHGGGRIASGTGWSDDSIYVWEAEFGEMVATYGPLSADIHALEWSPENQYLAAGTEDGRLYVWDSFTETATDVVFSAHGGYRIGHLDWASSGAYLATGADDGSVMLWEVESQGEGVVFAMSDPIIVASARLDEGNDSIPVVGVTFSPNSTLLATAYADGLVRITETRTGDLIAFLNQDAEEAHSLAWSANGQYLAVGLDYTSVEIWKAFEWDESIASFDAGNASLTELVWFSDGEAILSGSEDGTLRLWVQE